MIRLALSMGDPAGVGPELAAAVLQQGPPAGTVVTVYGDVGLLSRYGLGAPPPGVELEQVGPRLADAVTPGKPDRTAMRAALDYLRAACQAVESGRAQALVTGPIHKFTLSTLGQPGPGQTEWLARRFSIALPVMAFWSPSFSVVLATTHLPLAQVAGRLDAGRLERLVLLAHRELAGRLLPAEPSLALAALNPHGEVDGQPGPEESTVLAPVVERLRRRGLDISGPLAADSIFHLARQGRFQLVVALYHDQGLAPLKTLHFNEAVHLTLGLGFPRTSPDHGPAYELAGQGVAHSGSLAGALRLAARLAGAVRQP